MSTGVGCWASGFGFGLVTRNSKLGTQRWGFSLIELVIALAIMSVGLVGAMRVFPLGLRASQRTEMSSRATIVAQRTIEALKLIPAGELKAGETVDQDGVFEVTTRIGSPQVDGLVDPSRLKSVTVTVRWEQDDRFRELEFLTYFWSESS